MRLKPVVLARACLFFFLFFCLLKMRFPWTGFSITRGLARLREATHYPLVDYICRALNLFNHKLRSLGLSRVHDGDYLTFYNIVTNYNLPLHFYFPVLVELHIIMDRMFRTTNFLDEADILSRTSPLLKNDRHWTISVESREHIYRTFLLPALVTKHLVL